MSVNFASRRYQYPIAPKLWLGWCLAASVPSCSGTEADNPFAGPVDSTPCKGEPAYADYLARPSSARLSAQSLGSGFGGSGRGASFARTGQALTVSDQVPLTLECLAWAHEGETLQLQISNFLGGCAIDWTGGAGVSTPGHVVVQLDQNECVDALCGNCIYDTRAEVNARVDDLIASDSGKTEVTLRLTNCEGEATRSFEWLVPIASEPTGISCRPLGDYGAVRSARVAHEYSESQVNLYAPCDNDEHPEFNDVCSDDRTCVGGYCVPGCEVEDDCPLGGALGCIDGACLLSP